MQQSNRRLPTERAPPVMEFMAPAQVPMFYDLNTVTGAVEYACSRYKCSKGGRGSSKCLAVGTRVIMADGSLRAIEDVMVGEAVMGPDSTPREVLEVARGVGQLYRVQQSSAMDYVVNADHILSLRKSIAAVNDKRPMKSGKLRSPRGRYPSWPDVTNIGVTEAKDQSERWLSNFRGYRAGLLEFNAKPVRIDPYLLGLWLGDGTARELRITSADTEVIEWCAAFATECKGKISFSVQDKGIAQNFGLCSKKGRKNLLWEPFKAYGLPLNKHIPADFLLNSESVRLDLLAGLIDTDGCLHGNCYAISQVNERLARDIKYLADTLGFRTSIRQRETICLNNGARGTCWAISISGNAWRIPCKIARKRLAREAVKPNKDFSLSQIMISDAGVGEYAGFTLDGDHLFLLEDGTVTHNSWGIVGQAVIAGSVMPTRFLCVREVQTSMRASIHKLISNRIEELGLARYYDVQIERIVGKYRTRVHARWKNTEFEFAGIKTDPAKIKGFEDVDVCIGEEAEAYTHASWTFLRKTVRNAAGNSEIHVSFNPRHREDATSQIFIEHPEPGMRVVTLNWPENPWFGGDLRYELDIDLRALDRGDASERMQAQADYDHVWMGEYQRLTHANVIRHWVDGEVFEDPPAGTQLRFGLDWGYADDPLAGLRFWITDHKDAMTGEAYQELWISHEAFGTHIELNSVKRFLEDHLPGVGKWQVKADCAQPAMISHVKAAGMNISGAEKWSGSVEDGLAVVNKYRVIHIHARCPNTAREARLYSYKVDPMNPKNVLPIIIDKHNHSWDGIRYGLDGLIKHRRTSFD